MLDFLLASYYIAEESKTTVAAKLLQMSQEMRYNKVHIPAIATAMVRR